MASNLRRENVFQRLLVRWLIDPILSSPKVRSKVRNDFYKGKDWVKFVIRRMINPTIMPPPSYTRGRADAVYGEAFYRCVEFVARSRLTGDFLEFGTCMGYTARWLAGLLVEFHLDSKLYLYDSFEGLPELASEVDRKCYEAGENVWFRGAMRVDAQTPEIIQHTLGRILGPDRLRIVKGYYENVMTDNLPTEPVALVHLDCDLYASAKYVLDTLIARELLQDGTVLILDDYNCGRANPTIGERRAMTEAFEGQNRYLATPWFSYGWGGQVFFVHDTKVGAPMNDAGPAALANGTLTGR